MTTLIPCARVSTKDQSDNGTSLDSQIAACQAYIARLGATATAPIAEDVSGMVRLEDRPKGAQILALLAAGQADGVVWYAVDRFFRDNLEAMIQCRLWLRSGVQVHFVDSGPVKSENDIVFLLRTWQASDEREKIRERTMRGRVSRVKEGNIVVNRPPYGYRLIRGEHTLTLEVYEPEAGVVRLIYRWYVHGDDDGRPMSLYAIAERLQAMEIPTRGDADDYYRKRGHYAHWNFQQVHRIITSETYAGVWYYQRTSKRTQAAPDGARRLHHDARPAQDWIAVAVPPIVDRATWEAAQARIEINKERSRRNRKHDYFLSARVRCLLCGHAMSGSTDGKGVQRYKCTQAQSTVFNAVKCPMPVTRSEQIDPLIWGWVADMITHPDAVLDYLASQQDETQAERGALVARGADIEARIKEHDTAITRLLRLYSTGKYTDEQLDALTAEHHAAIADLREQARRIASHLAAMRVAEATVEDFETLVEETNAGIEDATPEDKAYYLERLDVHVFLNLEAGQRVAYAKCRYGERRMPLD